MITVVKKVIKMAENRSIFALQSFFLLFSLFVAVNCDELTILSSPKSLEFRGNSDLESESLSDVFAATLGYSVVHRTNWDGLVVKDPFNLNNGVVAVVAEGIEKLHIKDAHNYPLSGSATSFAIDDLLQKVSEHENTAFEINLKDSSEAYTTPFGDLKATNEKHSTHYLKPKSNKEDYDFLNQISLINSMADLIASNAEILPTVSVIRVSFEALIAEHSRQSPAIAEASKLLYNAIENLKLAAEKAYKGSVVVAVVTTDAEIIRSKRQAAPVEDEENPLNLAKPYLANYPVIFNIILWFSVVLVFSLLAISIAIATMDPGRDSIIYRMTSTRMKKDN